MQNIFPMPTGGFQYAGALYDTRYDALCAQIEAFFGEEPSAIADALLGSRLENPAWIAEMRDAEWLDDDVTDAEADRALDDVYRANVDQHIDRLLQQRRIREEKQRKLNRLADRNRLVDQLLQAAK